MRDIENEILEPVARQIRKHASSLSEIRRFDRCGIEGWLKVEAVFALSGMVQSINNEGPDLTLTDGTQIELKGTTDFNPNYIRDGCVSDDVPCVLCLFLADGSNPKRVNEIEDERVKVIYRRINDGSNDWIVGLAVPSPI